MKLNFDEVMNDVDDATPHQLIQMLLDKSVQQIHLSRHYMQEKQIANKGIAISKAMNIVAYLQSILKFESEESKTLSNHLTGLYSYIDRQLLQANIKNDPKLLDDALEKLLIIKSAWSEMEVS